MGTSWSSAAGQGWESEGAEFSQLFPVAGGATSFHETKKSRKVEVGEAGGGAKGCNSVGGGASYQVRGVP